MMQYYSGFDPTSWGSNVIHLAPTIRQQSDVGESLCWTIA
jgi:hypothetical protein